MGIGTAIGSVATLVGIWGLGIYTNRKSQRAVDEFIDQTSSWIQWTREGEGTMTNLSAKLDGRLVSVKTRSVGDNVVHDLMVHFRRPLRIGIFIGAKHLEKRGRVTVGTGDRRFHEKHKVGADNEADARRLLSPRVRAFLVTIQGQFTDCTDERILLTNVGPISRATKLIEELKQLVRAAQLVDAARLGMGTLAHEQAVIDDWRPRDDQEQLDESALRFSTVRQRCSTHATAIYRGDGLWSTELVALPSATLPATFSLTPKKRILSSRNAIPIPLLDDYNYELVATVSKPERAAIKALWSDDIARAFTELGMRGELSANEKSVTLLIDGLLPRDIRDAVLSELGAITAALSQKVRGAPGLYR